MVRRLKRSGNSFSAALTVLYTFARSGQCKLRRFFIKIYGSVTNFQPGCGTLNWRFLLKPPGIAGTWPHFCAFRVLTDGEKSGMIGIGNNL